MESLLAWATATLGIGIIALMIMDAKSGRVPLLSIRNFFFTGLLVYQIVSAIISFSFQDYWEVAISDPASTGFKYLAMLCIFLFIFGRFYRKGWLSFGIAKRLQSGFPVPGAPTMITLAFAMIGVAFFFRFVLIYIPIVNVLAGMISVSLAAAASAMVCWCWAKKITNPTLILCLLLVVGAAFFLATYQAFGRRDLVSVMGASVWGAYYGHFRTVSVRRAALPLAALGGIALITLAAFTSTHRRAHAHERLEMLRRLMDADIKAGIIDLGSGQAAAAISMWLIENRPEGLPYDTLHSLRYFTTNIIPREFYPGKPVSLGLSMVPEASLYNKSEGFTVGPGLVGHIANDNPWFALPIYAALMGILCFVLDDMIRRQPTNPFVVIPLGITLGDLTGLSRGELGLFAFRTVFAVVVVYVTMWIIAKLMISMGARYSLEEASPEALPPGDPHEYERWSHYGEQS